MESNFKILVPLTFLFVFSSCSSYYKASVSLEQASIQQSKVRIQNTNNDVAKYQMVIKENNDYYGVSKSNDRHLLVESDISSVRLYDKSGSTLDSILAATGVAVVALALIIITGF